MKEINIAEADVAAVASWITEHAEYICGDTGDEEKSLPSAIKVIRCVLSLRTSYDKVVRPRENTFREAHPDIKQVTDLANLIASYSTSYQFIQQELNFNSPRKANILQQLVTFLCQIVQKTPNVSEEESLKKWAIRAKPQECNLINIKHFKVAGFQYLRMLFGADTTKPDFHVKNLLSELLKRDVSAIEDIESILLLEESSKRVGLSTRDVDAYIWERGARQAND